MDNATNTIDAAMVLGVYGYAVVGFAFALPNLLIGLSVLKCSALRQLNQYVLLMTLALADAGTLIAYGCAGVYRIWITNTNQVAKLITPLDCLLTPHCILWITAYPFAAVTLVILSIDRLLMVSFPSVYVLSLPSPAYSHLVLLSGFVPVMLMAIIGAVGVFSSPNIPTLDAMCNPSAMFKTAQPFFSYYYDRVGYLAGASVLLFAAVPIVHRFRTNNLSPADAQSQNRMTKTIAISCVCTLLLYSIPDVVAPVVFEYGHRLLARLLWLLTTCNPIANVLIYQLRHHEMRLAVESLLKRKEMPQNLAVWPKPNQVAPVAIEMPQQPNKLGNEARPAHQIRVQHV